MKPRDPHDYPVPDVRPTVGSIVHYVVDDGEHCAAIVTAVTPIDVHLWAFETGSMSCQVGVPYDPEGAIGTWHWPDGVGGAS